MLELKRELRVSCSTLEVRAEHQVNHRVMGCGAGRDGSFAARSPVEVWWWVYGYGLRKERNLRGRVNVWVEQRSTKEFPFRDLHLPCEVEGSWEPLAHRENGRQEQSGKYLEGAMPACLGYFTSWANGVVCVLKLVGLPCIHSPSSDNSTWFWFGTAP